MQILRSHCHNEDDYSFEEIYEANANTLMQPFRPLEDPDAPQVTVTSAIRLVNRLLLIMLAWEVMQSPPSICPSVCPFLFTLSLEPPTDH